MSDEKKTQTPQEPEQDGIPPSPSKKTPEQRRQSVLVYLVVLFAVAFLLLLLSYFMQQRSNAQVIDGLRESVTTMRSLETLQEKNQQLEEENETMRAQLQELQKENDSLKQQLEDVKSAMQQAVSPTETPSETP